VRLTDGQFYWWRGDDRPAAFNYPTMYWRPGQVVRGVRELQVPPGTPPGTYYLELGVYGQGAGSDLNVLRDGTVAEGTSVRVASIQVDRPTTPADPQTLPIPNRRAASYGGDVRLLGATLLTQRALAGGIVEATLWWQALRAPGDNYRSQLVLQNGAYAFVVVDDGSVTRRYTTDQWSAREIVVDRRHIVVPADAPPGQTNVLLRVESARLGAPVAADAGSALLIGTFDVLDRKRVTAPPGGIQNPVDWKIGDFAHLIGSTISALSGRPGDHLSLTLYWQALGTSGDVSYIVFAHLLDATSLVKGQQDHAPGGGNDPTTGWAGGEYILDQYDLTIASDAAPGPYRIEVGMYDPRTGARLPVLDAAGQVSGDRVLLGTIEVRP